MEGKQNLKIAHVTTVHNADDVRIYHKEVRSLSEAGYNVVLIASALSEVQLADIQWVRLPRARNRYERFFRLTQVAYRAVQKSRARVVHLHDPELLLLGIALKLHGKKVIWDVHEDLPMQILSKEWIPKGFRPLISHVAFLAQKFGSYFFDAIITAEPAVASYFPRSKTEVIRNFPKLEEFSHITPYKNRPLRIVYVGGLTETRGIETLVHALDYVRSNVELALAGNFVSNDFARSLRLLPGWSKTRYLGWLKRSEVVALLNQSRIGMVVLFPEPNYVDALPIKMFEYMASATPFVASDFPLWREYGEGAGLFVDPKDPEAIADAIEWLINHPDEAEEMGRRGRELVEERYNWEAEAKKLLRLYEEVLKK